jgi:hypothetical protein
MISRRGLSCKPPLAIRALILPFAQELAPFRHRIPALSQLPAGKRRIVLDSFSLKIVPIVFASNSSHHSQIEGPVFSSLLIADFSVLHPEGPE